MAHFAKLNTENIVERVEVVSNDVATTEQAGITFLQSLYGADTTWKKTSYNTRGGKHYVPNSNYETESNDQTKAFRKNYAAINDVYDSTRDAFYSPQPYASWTLNETTCKWQAPLSIPSNADTVLYQWNETLYQSDNTQGWEEINE